MEKIGLGIDIGASFTRACIGYKNGKIVKKIKIETEKKNKNLFLKNLKEIVEKLNFKGEKIGISSFGPLDIKKKEILKGPNVEIKEKIRIGKFFEKLGFEIVLLNDCDCAVIAEKILGIGKNYENLVYLTFSTGIGAGAIINGKLLIGKRGNATEFGHIAIKTNYNLKCGCGSFNHWEAFCGGNGMENYFLKKYGKKFTAKEIFKNYNKNPFKKFLDEIMEINAIGIANIINTLEPEIIIVGGSVFLNNKEIFDKCFKKVEKYLINEKCKICPTKFNEDTPLIGALLISLEKTNLF